MKKICIMLGLVVLIFPQLAFAVWWNPSTWGKHEKMVEKQDSKREVPFTPVPILGIDDIRCTIEESGGIYDQNNSVEPKASVQIQDLQKDKNPIKFTFKINDNKVKILIGDAAGLSEVDGVVLVNNEDKIHIINSWGINGDNIQAFTIYPKTGFFTWVRMGDLLMLYNSLGYGHGRCL